MFLGNRRNTGPSLRRLAHLAAALVKLGEADQCIEVALVGLKRGFEGRPFTGVIAADPACLRQIEPKRDGFWIGLGGGFEMTLRSHRVVTPECLHAEQVKGDRMIGTETKRGFG